MRSTRPITMNLPHFSGVTRKLILIHLALFFGLVLLGWLSPAVGGLLGGLLVFVPKAVAHGFLWQLVTYIFMPMGIIGTLFGMLTLWFFGVWMEGAYGPRKLVELYLLSGVGAALLAMGISYTRVFDLRPDLPVAGAWAALMGLMAVFATVMGDSEMYLFFVLRMKAKYVVVIFLLWRVAIVLKGGDRLGALTEICGALCGWLYFKYSPARGFAFAGTERYFGLRNNYYRWKRRRAAKKFEVYMRKQDRVVKFDEEGRYIAPDEERRDPNDRKWMN